MNDWVNEWANKQKNKGTNKQVSCGATTVHKNMLKCHWDQNFGIPYFYIFEHRLWFVVTMPNFNLLRQLESLFSDGFSWDFAAAITGPCSGSWLANERKWRQRLTSNLVPSHGYLPLESKLSLRKDFLPSVCLWLWNLPCCSSNDR